MTDVLNAPASLSDLFVLQQTISIGMACGVTAPVSRININSTIVVNRLDCEVTVPVRTMDCEGTVPVRTMDCGVTLSISELGR